MIREGKQRETSLGWRSALWACFGSAKSGRDDLAQSLAWQTRVCYNLTAQCLWRSYKEGGG
jgi:hypothetical protein